MALLWLVAAAAWAAGVSTLADGADPENSLSGLCNLMTNVQCTVAGDDERGGFGKLNASLVSGCRWVGGGGGGSGGGGGGEETAG